MIKKTGWLNRRMAEDYLTQHEMMITPLYGNIATAGWHYKGGELRSGRFYSLVHQDRVRGFLARFNDGNCMVHGQQPEDVLELGSQIGQMDFHTLWMLGSDSETALTLNKQLALNGKLVPHYMMVQRKPQPVPNGELVLQDINREGLEVQYAQAACHILEACFHYQPSYEVFMQRLAERMPQEVYLLAQYEREWVAQAHIQAWTPHYGHIGGVATLPPYGGKGFGTQITARLCRYIHEAGRLPSLTVRTDNHVAIRMYSRLGFEVAGPVMVLDTYLGDD